MLTEKAKALNRLPRFLKDVPSLKFLDISLGSSAEMENFKTGPPFLSSTTFRREISHRKKCHNFPSLQIHIRIGLIVSWLQFLPLFAKLMMFQLQLYVKQQQQQNQHLWLSKRKRTSYSKVLNVFFLGCSHTDDI